MSRTPHYLSEESYSVDAELPRLTNVLAESLTSSSHRAVSPSAIVDRLRALPEGAGADEERFPSRIDRVTWACTKPLDAIRELAVSRFCDSADRYEEVSILGFAMTHTIADRNCSSCVEHYFERFARFNLAALESTLARAGYRKTGSLPDPRGNADSLAPANVGFVRGDVDPVIVAHLRAGPDAATGGAIFSLQLFFPWHKG